MLIFCSFVYANDQDDELLPDRAVHVFVNEGDINSLGKSLAKVCQWDWVKYDGSQSTVSWDERYKDCGAALNDVKKKHHFMLMGNTLMVKDSSDVFWYRPEYVSVSKIKKQIRSWVSSKVLKTYGFFEDSGLIVMSDDKKDFVSLVDLPPKQLHLRAVLWVTDQTDQSHIGFSSDNVSQMRFDQWLDHLHLMQGKGVVKVLAQPELFMTQDKKSMVYSGEEIPYVSSNTKYPQVLFKKALLSLTVKSTHIGDQGASMDIEITFDKASEHQYHGNVGIARQMVKSHLRLPYYTSRVMGGVKQHRESLREQCVPFISGFPVIGSLFCETSKTERLTMLYVMIMISPVSL